MLPEWTKIRLEGALATRNTRNISPFEGLRTALGLGSTLGSGDNAGGGLQS